jgi:hypothetical protein
VGLGVEVAALGDLPALHPADPPQARSHPPVPGPVGGAIVIVGGIKTLASGGGYGVLNLMVTSNSGLYEGSTISTVAIAIVPVILWLSRFGTIYPRDWRVRLFAGRPDLRLPAHPVGTEARTGLVCIAVLAMLMLRDVKRRFLYMGVVGLLGLAAIPFLPSSFSTRMDTISNHEADSSAASRLAVWGWTWDYAKEHPLGGGFEAYRQNRLQVHTVATSGDTGRSRRSTGRCSRTKAAPIIPPISRCSASRAFPGLILFLLIQIAGLVRMEILRRRFRREEGDKAWIAPLATALQSAQIIYLTGSLFVGIAFQPFVWMLLAVQIGLDLTLARRARAEGKTPFLEASGALERGLGLLVERDQRLGEGGDVLGLAAGDDIAVGHRFLVHHLAAGVAQVGTDRGPARDPAAPDHVRLHQQPRPVADGGDRLAGLGEGADRRDDALVHPELVGILGAPGQDERVVFGRVHLLDRAVDLDAGSVVALDLAPFERCERDLGAPVAQDPARLEQLRILEAVGGDHQDPRIEQAAHEISPSRLQRLCFVDDSTLPGITRKRRGRYWQYFAPDGSRITDRDEIDRLNAIGMPPAYESAAGSAPSPTATSRRPATTPGAASNIATIPTSGPIRSRKYERLAAFGRTLPKLRKRVEEDLARASRPSGTPCSPRSSG